MNQSETLVQIHPAVEKLLKEFETWNTGDLENGKYPNRNEVGYFFGYCGSYSDGYLNLLKEHELTVSTLQSLASWAKTVMCDVADFDLIVEGGNLICLAQSLCEYGGVT